MTIKTERISPTRLKVFDDQFGDDTHLSVSQTLSGEWAVRMEYSVGSSEVAEFDNAQDAVDAAVSRLRNAIDELDAAEASIGN